MGVRIDKKGFEWYVERADHFKAVEDIRVYLSVNGDDLDGKPWEFVTQIKDGSTWCNGVCTGIRFNAHAHPSGLDFSWEIDIQDRGESLADCDRLVRTQIIGIVQRLSSDGRGLLRDWLIKRAAAMDAKQTEMRLYLERKTSELEFIRMTARAL